MSQGNFEPLAPGVRLEGLKLQAEPAGRPVHPNVTTPSKEPIAVIITLVAADCPALTVADVLPRTK